MPKRASRRWRVLAAAITWAGASSPPEKNCTIVPSFVDTNILIYVEDRDAKGKHEVARTLIVDLWENREGVLSVQVLQEFYVNVTKKLKKPLTVAKAKEIIEQYLTWTVVDNTGRMLLDAIDLQRKAQLSFWDSLIVQAAIQSGCDRLYSEDMNAGQRFGPVTVVNPFK
jgi:predicted nucleic acid-binding protein